MIQITVSTDEEMVKAFVLMRDNMEPYLSARGEYWNSENIKNYFMPKENYSLINGSGFVGFMSIELDQSSIFIHTLQIEIKHQHRMTGYFALKWLVNYAMEKGLSFLRCGVFEASIMSNMYECLGFEKLALKDDVSQMALSLVGGDIQPLIRRIKYSE